MSQNKKLTLVVFIVVVLIVLFQDKFRNSDQPQTSHIKEQDLQSTTARTPASPIKSKPAPPPPVLKTSVQKEIDSALVTTEDQFLKKYPGNWKIRRDQDQRVYSLTGGMISQAAKDPAELLRVARELSPFLAGGDYQLSDKMNTDAKTPHLQVYDIDQTSGGFSVYQGTLSMIANREGDIFMINNRLKEVTPYNSQPKLTLAEAKDVVARLFPKATVEALSGPVIFSDNTSPSVLSWPFKVHSSLPNPKRLEVIISAESGDVLHQEEHLIQN